MYRFKIGETSVKCDTPAELHLALSPSSNGEVATAKTPRVPHTYRRSKPAGPGNGAKRSWAKAKAEAKRLGRDDVAAVRSELAAARAAAAE